MTDYYELLGVSSVAPVEEIRAAYRQRASLFHPDRNPGDSEVAKLFCEISHAYDILSDDSRRHAYDAMHGRYGSESLFDSLAADLGAAMEIFGQVAAIFEVSEPKKRSECTTCAGTGEATIELGPLVINRSCPDCEDEKPSTVVGDRP
jgi:DnaJ-class molecular chaperone